VKKTGPDPRSGSPDREEHRLFTEASLSIGFANVQRFVDETRGAFGPVLLWPFLPFTTAAELIFNSTDPIYRGRGIRFGDGKPIVLVPGHLSGDTMLTPLSHWLRAIGYRPVTSKIVVNMDDRNLDERIAIALRHASRRIGRKAVIVTFDTGLKAALRVATQNPHYLSDVIAVGLPKEWPSPPPSLRLHFVEDARRAAMHSPRPHIVEGSRALLPINPKVLKILSEILREIPISLLDQN